MKRKFRASGVVLMQNDMCIDPPKNQVLATLNDKTNEMRSKILRSEVYMRWMAGAVFHPLSSMQNAACPSISNAAKVR